MVNEERVKTMVKLAVFETKTSEELNISSYFKKDYVSFHRWSTMIWTTVGCILMAGLFVFSVIGNLLENLTLKHVATLLFGLTGMYVLLLVIYWIATGIYYRSRHDKARRDVKRYEDNLKALNQLYEKENM